MALLHLILRLEIENRAIRDLAAGVGALVNGLLKNSRVPALHEITVVAKSGRVTIGEHKLASHALERVGVPDGLVEERNEAGLKALGAFSVHHERRVGHVGFVVGGVDVLAVPARWEHHLETKAIGAILIQIILVGHVVTVERRLAGFVVVQAVEAKSLLAQGPLRTLLPDPEGLWGIGDGPGEIPLESITGDHTEALRKGLDVVPVEKVVSVNIRTCPSRGNRTPTQAYHPPLEPSRPCHCHAGNTGRDASRPNDLGSHRKKYSPWPGEFPGRRTWRNLGSSAMAPETRRSTYHRNHGPRARGTKGSQRPSKDPFGQRQRGHGKEGARRHRRGQKRPPNRPRG